MARYLTDLATACRKSGLKVVEQPGWKARGHAPMQGVRAVIIHHAAGPLKGNTPSLNVVQHGRAGLRGPLSQLFLARNGTVYVVAAGLSYHAGKVSHSKYSNAYAIGIEAENTGLANDPWPQKQYDAYVRLVAALVEHYKIPIGDIQGHREVAVPKGRKPDPQYRGAFKSMAAFRRDVKSAAKGPHVETVNIKATKVTVTAAKTYCRKNPWRSAKHGPTRKRGQTITITKIAYNHESGESWGGTRFGNWVHLGRVSFPGRAYTATVTFSPRTIARKIPARAATHGPKRETGRQIAIAGQVVNAAGETWDVTPSLNFFLSARLN